MGKAWKRRERTAPVTQDVAGDYKWSSQSYTLKDILNNFKLPVVIQCRDDPNAQHLQNFFFSLRQPILLHSRRTSRKVFARCVRKGGPGGTVKELLPEVVIPEDYPGWFKISKGLEFAKPVPHRSIDTLTRCNSEFFLCTTEFNAIVITEAADCDDNSSESFVRPVVVGEVLRKTGVEKLNRLLLPEPQRSTCADDRFLLCIDERDCELFVPLTQSGLFYEVSDGKFDKNENSVVQISDILDEMVELPLYVRHILGDPPPISKLYLPSLKLVRVKEEETVMGSTLECDEDKLPLEIQTNSSVRFEIALNTPMLQNSYEYTEALELCNDVSQNYVTEMKLAVNFKLGDGEEGLQTLVRNRVHIADENDNTLGDSRTDSQRTSMGKGSEFGEEDANSEFNIQWDPTASNRNTPVSQNQSMEHDHSLDDCVSIDSFESVDAEHAARLNSVLGGTYFDTQQRVDNVNETANYNPNADPKISYTQYQNLPSASLSRSKGVPVSKFGEDIVEGITDFSMRRNTNTNQKTDSPVRAGSPMEVSQIKQSSSFPDGLNHATNDSNHSPPFQFTNKAFTPDNQTVMNQNVKNQTIRTVGPDYVHVTTTSFANNRPLERTDSSVMNNSFQSFRSDRSVDGSFDSTVKYPVNTAIVHPQRAVLNEQNKPQTTEQIHKPYIFTGDVFISNNSYDSVNTNISANSISSMNSFNSAGSVKSESESRKPPIYRPSTSRKPPIYSSNDSLPESIASWSSNSLTLRHEHSPSDINGRTNPPPDIAERVRNIQRRSVQSPDNLITFDDSSRAPSVSSIVTCKAADEMVSSCKDLRLSLEEITKSSHDEHVENSWNEFCLERSSSLPVRSKTSPRKSPGPNEEHSHSWEQISLRRDDTISPPSSLSKKKAKKQTNLIERSNTKFDSLRSDKTQLLMDTSSDDSTVFDDTLPGDVSFTFSESDLSITDGQENLLAAIEEMDMYLDAHNGSDTGITNAHTLSRDKAMLNKKMKIRREIKRKQEAEWNDIVEVI